ncbi:hypothetical protein ACOJEA_004775 [Klebsiella aerogenes]
MKNGYITEYLSTLLNQPLVYGDNDCHIMALTVIDLVLGSSFKEEIYKKYTSPTGGRKYAKEHCSYPTLLHLCKELGELVTVPQDGDILITAGHITVFWRDKIITIDENKIYRITPYDPELHNYKIYRFRGK